VSGTLKKVHLSADGVCCKALGLPNFRASVSKPRFRVLLNCLRLLTKNRGLKGKGNNVTNTGNFYL
jgi:hypothetical protein